MLASRGVGWCTLSDWAHVHTAAQSLPHTPHCHTPLTATPLSVTATLLSVTATHPLTTTPLSLPHPLSITATPPLHHCHRPHTPSPSLPHTLSLPHPLPVTATPLSLPHLLSLPHPSPSLPHPLTMALSSFCFDCSSVRTSSGSFPSSSYCHGNRSGASLTNSCYGNHT